MKRHLVSALIILLCASVSLFAWEPVKPGYIGVYWGSTPEEVNDQLIKTNLIENAVEPEIVELYMNTYPDPDMIWFDRIGGDWVHLSMTTKLPELIKADPSIYYFERIQEGEFKRMIIQGDALAKPNEWVYRLYFHNDRLFAISIRYESEELAEAYRKRNPEMDDIHPGYQVPPFVFEKNNNKLKYKYGGYNFSTSKAADRYSSTRYGGYYNVNNRSMITAYFIEYAWGIVNYTVTYVDDKIMGDIYPRFQQRFYFGATPPVETIEF